MCFISRRGSIILWLMVVVQLFQRFQGRNSTCARNEFTCNDGECILKRWRCDDEADCKDSSDELNCQSYLLCNSNEFQCKKKKNCIPKSWRCDGELDCADKSDELNCYNTRCNAGEYRCRNGLCIQKNFQCDGENDCPDSSDEESCDQLNCEQDRFRCDSHRCIYKRWVCDGERDCANGNDEKNCSQISCRSRHWACQSGECIMESHRCDGDPDCYDNSDEIGCPTIAGNCKAKGMFRCQSGNCISGEWRCDGDDDCSDKSDEEGCGSHVCPDDNFLCPNSTGRCIKNEWLCDGENDCEDGSDERNCSRKNSTCLRTQFYCTNGQCIDQNEVCNHKKDCDDGSDEAQCPARKNQTSCGPNNGGCKHNCHDNRDSFHCSCNPGYYLDTSDLKGCKDINECGIPGFCSQECVNFQGSYNCSCREGYILQPDGRKCKALGSNPYLIFSSRMDIRKVDIQNVKTADSVVVNQLQNAIAVDYFFEGELIFWTDTTLRLIRRAFMNGTDLQDIVKFGLDTPCDLAVDWLGKKLFWADSETGRIEVVNFDGSQRKALFWQPMGRIRAIALHPRYGYLYWTEWDIKESKAPVSRANRSSISRANMDGTNFRRILHQDISWPNGLVIDYAMDRIFWIDAGIGAIYSSDLDGGSLRPIMGNDNLLHPFAMTLFEDYIYWTDPQNKAIFKARKFDGSGKSLVRGDLKSPMDITAFHPQRQPKDVYGCAKNNRSCSHICLATNSTDFRCACPTGYKLLNSTHCSHDIHEFIAYVGDFAVRRISLDTSDLLDVVLPFESVMDVFAMDWDPVDDEMYWADSDDGQITIRKGKMKPPHGETVVYEFPGKLSGIAVDWLSRKLYWSDDMRNQIRVCNLNGTYATVILWKKVTKPRNLILDVPGRYMYWSSHGSTVSINRAGMDGCCYTKLISRRIINPTGLTLDKKSNTLYWVDGGNKLHYFSLATKKRKGMKLSHHFHKLALFSIAVHGNAIYWTDSNLKKVFTASKRTGKDAKVIGKFKSNPVRIAAFTRPEKFEMNPCKFNNGECSHLCLLSPVQKLRCACPAGRRLQNDSKTCEPEILRFLMTNSDQRLRQVPLSMSYKTNILLPSEGNNDIFAFDIDVKHRTVYFAKKDRICHIHLSGGNETCILTNMVYSPGDIAFDPLRSYIYWTDFVNKKIYLAEGNGKFWTVIIWENLKIPSSITVAYKDGYIFWADIGKPASINRANADGSCRTEIISSSLKLPNSLAIDHSSRLLYWSDYRQQRIEQCDFNGKQRMTFTKGLAGATSIASLGRFLYWSEWNSEEVKRADKRQGGFGISVINGMGRVTGIKAVNLRKIPVSRHPCAKENGGCSHFCVRNTSGISCACPVGLRLLSDGKECETRPKASVLFSAGYTITRISLDTKDFTGIILPFEKPKKAIHLAYDLVMDRVYWTNAKGIYSAFTNGSDTRYIIKANRSSPSGLAVDWIGRNLYWTDVGQQTISVSKLDGSKRVVLISHDLGKPRDIVVHPMKGLLFWTDCGSKSRIERSHMDGQSRKTLISDNIHSPTGLAIDFDQELLYWADSFYHIIQRCNFAGEQPYTVIKKSGDVFGLALWGSYIFWTDHKNGFVQRATKDTGSERDLQPSKADRPMGIIAISREKFPESNACSDRNGNCTGLCLATPNGRSCAIICEEKLYFKESCQFEEIITTPFVEETTRCANGSSGQCPTVAIEFATKERTRTLVYVVAGIVFFVFIITMSVLVFLCVRRSRGKAKNGGRKEATTPRVFFKKEERVKMLNGKDTEPSVSFLSNSYQDSNQGRPNHERTRTVAYQPKVKPDLGDESQCLTISNV